MKTNKYQELKDNLIELYNYAKKYYYEDRVLTQKEKELLVKWSHVILLELNPFASYYDYDTTISKELKRVFRLIYASVYEVPMSYQIKHNISYQLNDELDDKQIKIIKNYLDVLKVTYFREDPDLKVDQFNILKF